MVIFWSENELPCTDARGNLRRYNRLNDHSNLNNSVYSSNHVLIMYRCKRLLFHSTKLHRCILDKIHFGTVRYISEWKWNDLNLRVVSYQEYWLQHYAIQTILKIFFSGVLGSCFLPCLAVSPAVQTHKSLNWY